jgi:exopolyphosphatase/guanosine-5'-triphosphate,3'-diphosphate pyrophosphatase
VIFDLAARQGAERGAGGADLRDASVRELQRRFEVDRAQARRVGELALELLDDAAPAADHEARRELGWAAALHEAGMMISHHDHHRHSAYLLAHVDAAGFSQSQLRRIGDLVLGQRGGLRKMEAPLQDAGFALHLLCLRLAVIACHARDDAGAAAITLSVDAGMPTIALGADWADANPRAVHLLRDEADAWAKAAPARAPRLVVAEYV